MIDMTAASKLRRLSVFVERRTRSFTCSLLTFSRRRYPLVEVVDFTPFSRVNVDSEYRYRCRRQHGLLLQADEQVTEICMKGSRCDRISVQLLRGRDGSVKGW